MLCCAVLCCAGACSCEAQRACGLHVSACSTWPCTEKSGEQGTAGCCCASTSISWQHWACRVPLRLNQSASWHLQQAVPTHPTSYLLVFAAGSAVHNAATAERMVQNWVKPLCTATHGTGPCTCNADHEGQGTAQHNDACVLACSRHPMHPFTP